jgi:hypothetical protein
MKTNFLIMLLIFNLIFNIYNVCFVKHNLSKPMKCDVDKRTEFMEKCINKIDLIHEPEQVSATGVIRQCEETSQNLYCTY